MEKIAIIGAAGYVGQYLVDELNKAGITPTTVTRSNGLFLLSQKKVNALTIDQVEAASFNEKYDVVINLAYPTGSTYLDRKRNDQIVELVAKLANQNTKIIHTSTIAVFGYKLDRPVVLEKVQARRDWDYVESKVYFENKLIERFKNNEVHIVRLGNIWGPGSVTWTVPLVNNILYGQPTAVYGMDGFSNTADVGNICSYLQFLKDHAAKPGLHFHHLAEFYDVKWSHWQEKFSKLFDMPVEYIYHLKNEKDSQSLWSDFTNEVAAIAPFRLLKKLYATKIAGSYLRSVANAMPAKYLSKAERAYFDITFNSNEAVENLIFFQIMSGQVPFKNQTWEGWVPPINIDQSWERVQEWLKEIKVDY
jgi:nucleoside-diphosphate-sugar epimerase